MTTPTRAAVAAIKAEALREAARDAEQEPLDEWPFSGLDEMRRWLNVRADRIEALS